MTEHLRKLLTKATPAKWRARKIRYGAYSIEAEMMCMNGLRAWFEVASVFERDHSGQLMSEGALADAEHDAEIIIAARNAVASLLDKQDTDAVIISEMSDLLRRAIGYEPQFDCEIRDILGRAALRTLGEG